MEDKKYGTYYGEIVYEKDLPENFTIKDIDNETDDFLEQLNEIGVKNIAFDIENENDYSDTIFFEVDDYTDMNRLLVLITKYRPHEFSEESNNCFRMWFD